MTRTGALCAVLMLAAALPCVGQTVAQDEAVVRQFMAISPVVVVCEAIGYRIDTTVSDARMRAAATRLRGQAGEARLFAAAREGQAAAESLDLLDSLGAPFKGDPAMLVHRFESDFAAAEQRCNSLADDERFLNLVTRAGFQAAPGEKTYWTWIDYGVAHGDARMMVLSGEMYVVGGHPGGDADHRLEFDLFSRGAEGGNPRGASMLSADYLDGRGAPRDLIQAEKWAIIAEAEGQAAMKATVDAQVTPEQRAEAQALADRWLKAHSG